MNKNSLKTIKIWHKKPSRRLLHQISLRKKLNFLYQENNVYVMDNHLGAGWCWLNELESSKSYNFIHLDHHTDLWKPQNKLNLFKGMPLAAYTAQDIDWAKYIKAVYDVYPRWFQESYFVTFDGIDQDYFLNNSQHNYDLGSGWDKKIGHCKDKLDTFFNLNGECIFNLDLDYFVKNEDNCEYYNDEEIIEVIQKVKMNWEKIAVLTIALSPDVFCPELETEPDRDKIAMLWKKSLHVMDIVSQELGIDFQLKIKQSEAIIT